MGDFIALYGRDPFTMIWVKDTRPVIALIERLSYEPYSLHRARVLEDDRFFGYTPESQRLDNVQDELKNVQYVLIKSNSDDKKHVEEPEYVNRPGSENNQHNNQTRPASLDDVGLFFSGA